MKDLSDKAINIKGKKYVLVSDRVLYFNETYPNGAIETNYSLDGDTYHFFAKVIPDVKIPLRGFTGHSQATIGDGTVNKTAAMENAETSAVGRALALMGIGVLDSIASADEMNKAVGSTGSRGATPKQIDWMRKTLRHTMTGTDPAFSNDEVADKTIQKIIGMEPGQVPISKVKDAVDRIAGATEDADKDEVYEVDDQPINLEGVPY